ncbi:MAG TPA: cupin domain-containing protein [Candidatus Limnocylindria bacterium]|nr:cupin domain-containing protein [Candidatus Limnocylindria bacterium]
MSGRKPAIVTPLTTWFSGEAALARFRRERLGRGPVVLTPRDAAWRGIVPSFDTALAMAAAGLPFQIAADRRYDRSGDRRRLRRAVAAGKTVFVPQAHQVLPRLARLMVALRAAFFGPSREECSFLFAVQGRGREGMGLHHDGEVDSMWLQLEGRRTVTLGPRVPRGTPEEMSDDRARAGWPTIELEPGTLLSMPSRTPHRVVCHGRSLAVSLTWARRRRGGAGAAGALAAWDVVSGRVDRLPARSRTRLWTQVPAVMAPGRRAVRVRTTQGAEIALPPGARALARRLVMMPALPRGGPHAATKTLLARHGLLAPHDLPLRILPDDPAALDGWRFA